MALLSLLLAIAATLCAGISITHPVNAIRVAPRLHTRTAQHVMKVPDETMDDTGSAKSADSPENLSADAKRVYRKMRSATGVEVAPWLKVDPEAIARAERERKERKAKAAARARELEQLDIDPQAAELGGGGLSSKVLSEDEVELRWSTGVEADNVGFIVQRRPGGSQSFEVIASYEKEGSLKSKGPNGGSYTFIDDTVPSVGTWVYRVLDCDADGKKSALSQKLVEVDSKSEQTTTLIIGGVLLAIAGALVFAGLLEDPIQTTSAGRSGFGF